MADRIGVLGQSSFADMGIHTVYMCPASKAAKFRIIALIKGGAGSVVNVLVNGAGIAITPAMTLNHYVFTNGGAGFWRAPAATLPSGISAAETCQPAPPIFYLSAGQTVVYGVTLTDLVSCTIQVVGIEVDLAL